jgi:hypothetical protein
MFVAVSRTLTMARDSLRVVVTCALALAAIGAACAEGAGPTDSTAGLVAIQRLSAAQYAALDHVFVVSLPLDRLQRSETAPQSKLDAATNALVRACNKLSTRDPLLRAMRSGCAAIADVNEATRDVGACSDPACVRRAIKSARAAMHRIVSGSRTSDRAVNATHLPARCKRALVAPPDSYPAYDELDEAFDKLDHALATRSDDELAAAEAALTRAEKKGDRLPTAKRLLQLFRSGCR